MTSRVVVAAAVSGLVGILIGGHLFSRSQPRSLIALRHCEHCLSPADLAGLLGSVGVQKLPGLIPFVVFETERTIAIQYPGRPHYVIIPKKDLKDIGQISKEDEDDLLDAYLVARHLIERNRLRNYRFYTNGPGEQSATYLHFHLVSR